MLTLIESELTTDWLSCHLCTDTCQHVRHLRHKHSLYPGSDKTDSGNIHQNLGSGSGQNVGGCDGHILLGNGTYLGIWILSSSTYRPIEKIWKCMEETWGQMLRNWQKTLYRVDCLQIWNFEFKKLAIAFSCPKSWFRRDVISIFARDCVSDLRYLVRECL